MKLFTKKLLVPAAIAASVAVSIPAMVGADFDLTGLNNQVQSHEARITTLESTTPTATTPGPVGPTGQPVQTKVAPGASAPATAVIPVPLTLTAVNPTATPEPTPVPTPFKGNVTISGMGGIPTSKPIPTRCYRNDVDPVTGSITQYDIPCF